MANTGWKIGKKVELNNSLQIATYRQVMQKETKPARKTTLRDIEEKKDLLEGKNAYMDKFKTEKTKMKETKRDKKTTLYVYDQVKADE